LIHVCLQLWQRYHGHSRNSWSPVNLR
jgi:hypothetical protein